MKRLCAFLLALCMMLACSSALAEITYPLESDKPIQITVWMAMNAGASQIYTNYMENPVYQAFAEKVGVELEIMHPTYGSHADGFATMLLGDELPDVIIDFDSYYNGGSTAAYDDGLIWDLTPYLEEYAPDYYAIINQSDDVRRQFYNEENRVLNFSSYTEHQDSLTNSIVVRADWCEEFGIDPSQINTFDELEAYLQGVVDNKPGVIPFLTSAARCYTTLGMGYNVFTDFYNVDGEVQYYATSQQWRDFLTRMHSWYEKGYITEDFGSVSNANVRKMFSAGTAACIVVAIGNAYSDAMATGMSIAKTPYVALEEDTAVHVYDLNVNKNTGNSAVITVGCEEEKLPYVMRFLNYGYTEEGHDFVNWGPEGVSWYYQEDGTRKHTDWILNNELYETSITHQICSISYWPCRSIPATQCSPNLLRDEGALTIRLLYSNPENWDNAWLMSSAVSLTTEENADRNKIMANVETYTTEMAMKFLRGEADIETEWDAYVKQLEDFDLAEAIEITQNAYDRYVSR